MQGLQPLTLLLSLNVEAALCRAASFFVCKGKEIAEGVSNERVPSQAARENESELGNIVFVFSPPPNLAKVSAAFFMVIRFNTGSFDTDQLVLVERAEDGSVCVTLTDEQLHLVGIEAQQVWAQITEHEEVKRPATEAEIAKVKKKWDKQE